MTNDLIFFSATANDRFSEAVCLFKSIKRIYPDAECFFDGLMLTEDQVEELGEAGVSVKNFASESDFPSMFLDRKDDIEVRCERNDKAFECGWLSLVCASWRLHMGPRLRRETGKKLLWLDTDCILRKPIDSFLQKSDNHDVSAILRKGLDFRKQVLTSVFFTNNTERGNIFLESFESTYRDVSADLGWWTDPHTLNQGLQVSGARVFSFESAYNDSTFHRNSPIWHSKHGKGKRHPKWLEAVGSIMSQ